MKNPPAFPHEISIIILRLEQMRIKAKRENKVAPTIKELWSLIPRDMICRDCDRVMVWTSKEDQIRVVTLQHYRDSTLALVCRSCNSRHAFMPGDTYRDLPKDYKFCPGCKNTKLLTDFYGDNRAELLNKTKSRCKECSNKLVESWRKNNKYQYNAYQRQRRKNLKGDSKFIGA